MRASYKTSVVARPACKVTKKLLVWIALAAQLLVVSLTRASAPAAQTPWFAAREDSIAGTTPQSLAVGDFNGDGIQDEAVANAGSNNISILLGNGDGTFQPPVNYAVGTTPSSVLAADFNSDGKLDLAVANAGSNNLSVLLGNGDGTFHAAVNYAVGSQPVFVAAADFNHDGNIDLSVANENCASGNCGDGTVSILLGKGDGTFGSPQSYGVGVQPVAIGIADFNADGNPDLAVVDENCPGSCGTGLVSILLGNGDGTFQNPGYYPEVGTEPVSVAVQDFNGDGIPDLAVVNENCYGSDPSVPPTCEAAGSLSILLGEGNGNFSTTQNYTLGTQPLSVAAGDLNHDGKQDLAVAVRACSGYCTRVPGAVVSLLGNGDGTFQSPQSFQTGESPDFIAVADFNNDGNLDVTTANSNGYDVSVLAGLGNGSFEQAPAYAAGGVFVQQVIVGDFHGNGKLDIVADSFDTTSPSSTSVSLLPGNGDGTFQTAQTLPFHDYGVGPAGDFNGDGKLDLVLIGPGNGASGSPCVALGNGNGSFQSPNCFNSGQSTNIPAVGDFNGDGKLDLALAGTNSIAVLLGNGDGTFQAPKQFAAPQSPQAILVGDFNNDGKPDVALLVGGASAPEVAIFLGNGDGTFQPPQQFPLGGTSFAYSFTSADFNGDGKLDLAVAQTNPNGTYEGTVAVLLGNGDGTFQAPHEFVVGEQTYSVTVVTADFNGDGKPDLAVVNYDLDSVSVLLGNGDGTFQTARFFGGGQDLTPAAVGDFNGDGKPDLAVGGGSPSIINVFLNTFAPPSQSAPPTTLTASPTSLSFGDQQTGTSSALKTVAITNSSSGYVTLSGFTISSGFNVVYGPSTPDTLGPNETTHVSIDFSPGSASVYDGTLTVNSSSGPLSISLSGTGTGSSGGSGSSIQIMVSPSSVGFGSQPVGSTSASQTIAISNTGSGWLKISGFTITGPYTFTSEPPVPDTLLPGETTHVNIAFAPTASGNFSGTFTVVSDATSGSSSVALTGQGD